MEGRRGSVTIREVAADAGVSLQTVSRVINNSLQVRPETRAKVQASVEKLGYVPLIAAQRLSGRRSYLILALNDRDRTIAEWKARQGGDWVDQMLLGGMLKCAEYGYRLMLELVDTHSEQVARGLGAALSALQPDGVLLTPPHSENPQICTLLTEHGIPFVRLGARGSGAGLFVTMDEEGSARRATQHLLDLGHERIGFISGPSEYGLSAWRADGWESAMVEAGRDTHGLLAQGDFGYQSGLDATRRLLSSGGCTAIIASNDQMALAALEVARQQGLEVPDDLSLVSFDNTPVVRFSQPPLTAVDQPIAEAVARAVELLLAPGEALERHEAEVVAGGFVVRESTGPAKVNA